MYVIFDLEIDVRRKRQPFMGASEMAVIGCKGPPGIPENSRH